MIVLLAALRADRPGADPGASAPDEQEVQRLVAAAQGGDQLASGRLYQLHVRRVFRTVRPLCTSDAAAEDVVADAFVKALRAIGGYRRRPGARFLAWLLTIARNTARRQAVREARRVPTEAERLQHLQEQATPLQASHLGLAEGPDDDPRRRALLTAMAELKPRAREVVSLRYAAGLSAAEVAAICGVTQANVRKIAQRSRVRLLRRVSELLDTDTPASGATR